MPTTWETFPIEFRGGLISNQSPLQQGINSVGSATLLQNYEPAKQGGYSKLRGYDKAYAAAVSGSGRMLGLAVVDTTKAVAIRSNGTVSQYWYNAGAGWTSAGTAASLGSRVRFTRINFNGTPKIVFVDGVNAPSVYNTVTNGLVFLTTAPAEVLASSSVIEFKSHVFYAKGDVLSFTAPFVEDDFLVANGAGTIRVGSNITGLAVFRNTLIVFSEGRVQQVTGSSVSDFALQPITEDIGCIDGNTIQEIGGDIIYLAPDGLRLLSATDRNDDFALEIASDPISKDANTFLNSGGTFSSLVIREKNQYRIFSYINSETPQVSKGLLAVKFSDQGASRIEWATTKGIRAAVSDSAYTGSFERIIFANEDGYIYRMDVGNSFDSLPIEAIFETPYMPISDPQIRKTFYKMTLYVTPNGGLDLKANIRYDFGRVNGFLVIQPPTIDFMASGTAVFTYGSSGSVYGTAIYGGELDKVYSKMLIGSGKTFSIRFEENSTNPSHTLDSAIVEFKPLDRQ